MLGLSGLMGGVSGKSLGAVCTPVMARNSLFSWALIASRLMLLYSQVITLSARFRLSVMTCDLNSHATHQRCELDETNRKPQAHAHPLVVGHSNLHLHLAKRFFCVDRHRSYLGHVTSSLVPACRAAHQSISVRPWASQRFDRQSRSCPQSDSRGA